MSDRPKAGETYYDTDNDDEETEIAEVLEDQPDGRFKVADEDGDEAIIYWNNGRWEVDQ